MAAVVDDEAVGVAIAVSRRDQGSPEKRKTYLTTMGMTREGEAYPFWDVGKHVGVVGEREDGRASRTVARTEATSGRCSHQSASPTSQKSSERICTVSPGYSNKTGDSTSPLSLPWETKSIQA